MPQGTGQVRLLTRPFLRRFVDNDLISTGEDQHASIAVVLAAPLLVSATVALALPVKCNPRGAQPLARSWRWRWTTRRCCSAAR
jgi:hypothetical protein